MDEFREGLTEEEQLSYDDLVSQGYTIESIKVYLEKYDDNFDEAWDALEKNPEKELTEKEQEAHDKMVTEGYSESSIETFFEDYKDGYESAMKDLITANPEVIERKRKDAEEKKRIEDETEYDIYGEPYDDVLNPKREEDQVYDKDGKLKGKDDTDYEKMLSGEGAPDKKAEEEDLLDAIYPKMAEKKDETLTGLNAEYPSMQNLPDKRDPVESSATEEEKKFLEDEYPEMEAEIPDRQ